MKRQLSTVNKVYQGLSAITKVFRGTTLIWADWIYKTGNLVAMGSPNSPSPFVASDYTSGFNLSGNPFQVFDNNDGTFRYGEANNAGQVVGASLAFGKNIKIQNVYIRVDSYGGLDYAYKVVLDAYDAINGVWRNLYTSPTLTSGQNVQTNIGVSTSFEFSNIRLYAYYNNGGTLGAWWVNSCQITQWYEKG